MVQLERCSFCCSDMCGTLRFYQIMSSLDLSEDLEVVDRFFNAHVS